MTTKIGTNVGFITLCNLVGGNFDIRVYYFLIYEPSKLNPERKNDFLKEIGCHGNSRKEKNKNVSALGCKALPI